jgi:hypothetical protein
LRLALSATLILVLLLAVPFANAHPQSQHTVKLLSIDIIGSTAYGQVIVDGTLSKINASISGLGGSDPVVYYDGNYAEYPEHMGNTPYSWYTGVTNPNEIYVWLSPVTALDATDALGAIAILVGTLTGIPTGGLGGVVAGIVIGLLSLDYSNIYGADHSNDNSLSLWIPTDWFNIGVMLAVDHSIYLATPRYWWFVAAGAYAIAYR